jgi:hypothetical protein
MRPLSHTLFVFRLGSLNSACPFCLIPVMRPLIVCGPAGCGKSYWIQKYAERLRKELCVCPCRKDRTLREGRQKLHLWGRRREPIVLWLEGADDLTPEAQAFLRRILETHAPEVQFVLECRDPGKLQEPIRSRCVVESLDRPTEAELRVWMGRSGSDLTEAQKGEILEAMVADEVSWRRVRQCCELQKVAPAEWRRVLEARRQERALVGRAYLEDISTYQSLALSPEVLLNPLLADTELLGRYGECLDSGGSPWAFLACALPAKGKLAKSREE